MLKEKPNPGQISSLRTFEEQLNHKHPLYILSNKIDWDKFEKELKKHYHETMGRLVREIERKLSADRLTEYSTEIKLFKRVLKQKRRSFVFNYALLK